MIAVSLKLWRLVLWSNTWRILENDLCAPEKKGNPVIAGWSILHISAHSNWSIMLFISFTSLLIFYQVVLSIIESEVLKFSTILVDLSISSFNSSNICYIYLEVLMVDAYIFIIVTPFRWTDPIIIIYYHSCLFS